MLSFSMKLLTGLVLLATIYLNSASARENPLIISELKKLSLEELMNIEVQTVYAASKHEQNVKDAPSSVSIITSSEIMKYGYRSLADLLRSVRSFFVTYDRNYSYLGARGFGRPGDYNSRILLLIDGHRTNDNIFDQAFIGTESMIDVDLIDRVEVIRGPGSSLYGNNAFFAIVNVITKKGGDLDTLEVSGESSRYKTYKGRLTYGKRLPGGIEMIVSGTGYNSSGQQLYYPEYDAPESNNGIADGADYDRNKSFFTKASVGDVTFQAAYNTRTKGIPTGSFGTDFNDRGNKTTDEHASLDLKYNRNLGEQSNAALRVYYDYYRYDGSYAYYSDPATGLNKDLAYGSWWGTEIKFSTRMFEAHHLILGAEYTTNFRQDQENYNISPYTSYLDDRRKSQIWAAYLQDEFSLADNIIVNAGVRYDRYDTFGDTANPRAALIYRAGEKSTVKLLYGSAFRAPNNYELYYLSPTSDPPMAPNPDLKPEKIDTYELVYEQRLGDQLRVTAAGYYYKIKDLINQTTDDSGNSLYMNIDDVRARGFEVELARKWTNGLDGRLSYTVQRTRDKLTGEQLTNSPAHLAKLNISMPILNEKVFMGIEEQYTSRRKTIDGNYAGGVLITNVTLLGMRIVSNLDVSASVYNVFAKQYSDPVSEEHEQDLILQDARNYRLKATYLF